MKNFIVVFCGLLVVAASCRKVDDSSVFNQSADQRLTAALTKYQTKLTSAQYGWKALVGTEAGGNFTFYFSFNDSNRVKMLSSFDAASAVTLKESSYRLKALQQPSLIFDTYSYLHVLADPNPYVNGGNAGEGLVTDFEFYFDDTHSSTDTIALVGRYNGSKTTLVRATQAERDAFINGELVEGLVIGNILNYYKRIIIDNTDSTDIYIDTRNSFAIRTDATGNLLDESLATTFTLTLGGISFADPVTVGTKTLTELSNINYDAATKTITATGDGQSVVIRGVVKPMLVDVDAPRRFWNFAMNDDSYWITEQGFHINGVDDAQGITNLPGYFGFSVLWPAFGQSSGQNYDLLAPVTPNTAGAASVQYGYAFRSSNFTADGRVIFPYVGARGAPLIAALPTAANATMQSLRTQMAIPQGYYLVQISNDPTSPAYHMVSAADGLAWVTWLY